MVVLLHWISRLVDLLLGKTGPVTGMAHDDEEMEEEDWPGATYIEGGT